VCDRDRQSEIYAQPDAVSASLVRAAVVIAVRGIKRRRISRNAGTSVYFFEPSNL